MADAVTSQTLFDGPRNVVMKFTNLSDGSGESAVKKVDVTALSPNPGTSLRITRIVFDINTGGDSTTVGDASLSLLWEASANVVLGVFSGYGDTVEMECGPGIVNTKAAGATGSIMFTTNNFVTGCSYTVVLYMKKN